jgi:hypothetical protein
MAEALNGTFKAELIKLHGPWRTRDATEIAIIEWIDWSTTEWNNADECSAELRTEQLVENGEVVLSLDNEEAPNHLQQVARTEAEGCAQGQDAFAVVTEVRLEPGGGAETVC